MALKRSGVTISEGKDGKTYFNYSKTSDKNGTVPKDVRDKWIRRHYRYDTTGTLKRPDGSLAKHLEEESKGKKPSSLTYQGKSSKYKRQVAKVGTRLKYAHYYHFRCNVKKAKYNSEISSASTGGLVIEHWLGYSSNVSNPSKSAVLRHHTVACPEHTVDEFTFVSTKTTREL